MSPRSEQVSDALFAQLSALATCLCAAIDPVCRCDVVVGDQHYSLTGPDFDDCGDECGEAWVRMVLALPRGDVRVSFGGQPCWQNLRLTLEVGVMRCLPIPERGEAVSEAVMAGLASQQVRDLIGSQEAILCCEHFDGVEVEGYTPDTDGNLSGGYWTISVTL